eukprot:TRINITY_DN6599_c0_g1_i2.p1 TRINITY_DN6599_c0_g1~~TRINITY_DN6599_c0_g1_i2.p1  ORF type:complete len:155 (-),score=20.10 TRINITY_DN6599_c0_g1_i2:613-1077(-)
MDEKRISGEINTNEKIDLKIQSNSLELRNIVPMSAEKTCEMKERGEFRNYQDSPRTDIVNLTYQENHTKQTVRFVQLMKNKYNQFTFTKMSIWDAISRLSCIVDDSDPDAAFPQSYHAFQTAEVNGSLRVSLRFKGLEGQISTNRLVTTCWSHS